MVAAAASLVVAHIMGQMKISIKKPSLNIVKFAENLLFLYFRAFFRT